MGRVEEGANCAGLEGVGESDVAGSTSCTGEAVEASMGLTGEAGSLQESSVGSWIGIGTVAVSFMSDENSAKRSGLSRRAVASSGSGSGSGLGG